ncbi:transglutaminase domain-containing protein [Permianibacter aggregans]|uniref:transglutaminase-like domain-containing protein n=1 Tax=Permianibacter aggregans TaxID=1510150 RepID=UPI0012FCF3F4|nr:transglutaminase-like domain-containing protein [Permianibacter aggregans]QGX38488.1 transglutaminase domain-containing protein [Permianibacter aggregans]
MQNNSWFHGVRRGGLFTRFTAWCSLSLYLFVFYTPAAYAIADKWQANQHGGGQTVFALLDTRLREAYVLSEHLRQAPTENHRKQLLRALTLVQDLSSPLQALELTETEQQQWQQASTSLQRYAARLHHAAVDEWSGIAAMLRNTLAPWQSQKAHHAFDNNMPFGPEDRVVRAPASDANALLQAIQPVEPAKPAPAKAVSGKASAGNGQSQNSAPLNVVTAKAGSDTNVTQMASSASTQAPQNTDLLATIDAPLTPAILAKAAELNHDPAKIFNFVYNEVRFVPSYGSIQGADYTLQSLRGNSFDTSSLLIALLRASNIPARYRYGTIWLKPEVVQNWVGGVQTIEAAQNLLSQGGIPNTRMLGTDGEFIKLEHVWVEAYGVFNTLPVNDGSAQWLALDASLKQYQYASGLNLQESVPLDGERIANEIKARATVNDSEGWVQNLDGAYLQTELSQYREQIETFLNQQHPEATVAEVIGGQRLIKRESNQLDRYPSYQRIDTSVAFSALPDSLRHQFKYELLSTSGNVLFSFVQSTPELAGKSLSLSFRPASAADEQTLINVLPPNPQTVEDLPKRLPANLIQLKAEFSVQGQMQLSHGNHGLGKELITRKGYWNPRSGWQLTDNPVIAGEYQAIGLDLQGLAANQLNTLKNELEQTKAKLEAQDLNGISNTSSPAPSCRLGCKAMALTRVQSELSAQVSNMVYYRQPSYGTFSTSMSVDYWFGNPRYVNFDGVLMDIDRVASNTESKINCYDAWKDFNQANGAMLSAFEHLVPEQLFSTPQQKAEGVSAVKAIAIANAQGQRIYTIDQNNLETALSQITLDIDTENDIRAAVESGKQVTTHQNPITYHGWTGAGYIITDTESGAGAYKISGGADGGVLAYTGLAAGLSSIVLGVAALFTVMTPLEGMLVFAALSLLFVAGVLFLSAAIALDKGDRDLANNLCETAKNLVWAALGLIVSAMSVKFGALKQVIFGVGASSIAAVADAFLDSCLPPKT